MAKVLAALSGGVDSSAAAALLVQQGHEVVGAYMKSVSKKPRLPTQHQSPQARVSAASNKLNCASLSM